MNIRQRPSQLAELLSARAYFGCAHLPLLMLFLELRTFQVIVGRLLECVSKMC